MPGWSPLLRLSQAEVTKATVPLPLHAEMKSTTPHFYTEHDQRSYTEHTVSNTYAIAIYRLVTEMKSWSLKQLNFLKKERRRVCTGTYLVPNRKHI